MEKLKKTPEQTQMSKDLTEDLDKINPIQIEKQMPKPIITNNTNIFRNLSMMITSIEQRINTIENKYESKIEELNHKINNFTCQHKCTQKVLSSIPKEDNNENIPSLNLHLSSDSDGEGSAPFTKVQGKKEEEKIPTVGITPDNSPDVAQKLQLGNQLDLVTKNFHLISTMTLPKKMR